MLSGKSRQTFRKTDEPDSQRPLIYDTFHRIVRSKAFRAVPKAAHDKRELLGKRGLLKTETLVELSGSQFSHFVKLTEKRVNPLIPVFKGRDLKCEAHYVDCGERQVAPAYGSRRPIAVLEYTCAASHSRHLMHLSLIHI